ncbi:MAG: hypothetical protein J3R72DRAFT_446412 [Linnemannia gamsii]|nr:MAG: hypothetical protein J3R72DRAFT_446412 [Linnemannia gamsii]
MKVKNHPRQRSEGIKAPMDKAAGAAFLDPHAVVVQESPPPKEPSGNNKLPAPGSERWYELGCPGLVVNGVLNRDVIRNFDIPLLANRITNGLGSVPKAQREPKAFSGIFCSEKYLNGTCCIAEVSRDRDICEFHRKGKLRKVTCTSFTKEGLQCKETKKKMKPYSQQEEWGHLCGKHGKSMLQRGHLYRSGMPASLLARVEISPSILSKDLEDQKEHNDLSFELSQREEIIITADEFNDLAWYLDSSIKKRLRTVICSYFQFLSSGGSGDCRWRRDFESFTGKSDLDLHEECLKKGYVYIMECNEHDMANVRLIQDFDSCVGFKIGYSGNLEERILEIYNCKCKVKLDSFRAFPGEVTIQKLLVSTEHDVNPLGFAYLLEKIMHEIYVAHQYDISCKHGNWRGRTTHTEFFWFRSAPGENAPYEKTKLSSARYLEL